MNRYGTFILIYAGLLLREGAGQTPVEPPAAPPALTIERLVADALDQNAELEFYRAEIDAAKAGVRLAGRLANPEIGGEAGQKRVREGGVESEGIAWSVTVAQPFEWPGRIGLRKAIANRDVGMAELGLERFRAALAGRVRVLAFGIYAAEERRAAAAAVAERFEELRRVLVQRDPAGLAPLLETRVIEASELAMRRRAGEAKIAVQTALFELNQLRGAALDAPLKVLPARFEFKPAPSTESLVGMAWTNNFELRMRVTELEQQGFRVELARNERFPSFTIGPAIAEERAGDRERFIGVGVSIPLPLWNRNREGIAMAEARRVQAEVMMGVARRDIGRRVFESAAVYRTRTEELRDWRPDSIQRWGEAAALADRHYRLGAVAVATYVELQESYLDAVEGLLDARTSAIAAAAELEQLSGLRESLVTLGGEEGREE